MGIVCTHTLMHNMWILDIRFKYCSGNDYIFTIICAFIQILYKYIRHNTDAKRHTEHFFFLVLSSMFYVYLKKIKKELFEKQKKSKR